MLRVTIFNEGIHEKKSPSVQKIYPNGLHAPIADHLRAQGMEVQIAQLDMPEHGLSDQVLDNTDVLMWWGHMGHNLVDDKIAKRVHGRVLNGLGLVVMHSGHWSKIFQRLMGTSCGLCWREVAERERLWVVNPNHPITKGLGRYIEIDHEEMYGEQFDIPEPDELLFISWFEGGEVFRSGAVWHRGKGKIFYFRPGHETYPTFYNKEVLHVLANGVQWAKFDGNVETKGIGNCFQYAEPLEKLSEKTLNYQAATIEHPKEFLQKA